MRSETVVITGATGYLGGRLARGLREGGRTVVALALDLRDRESVRRTFADVPEGADLLHLAAANEFTCAEDLGACLAINGAGTQHVLDSALERRVRRVLFFSTFHVYGDVPGDLSESTAPNPLHPYGISKQVGEQLCRASARRGHELAIVRLSNAIGAPASADLSRWSLLCLDLCRQAHAERHLRLRSAGYQERDFIGMGDVQRAVERLLEVDGGALVDPVFNVGSGVATRVRDLAAQIQAEYARLYGEPLSLEAPDGSPGPPGARFVIDRLRGLGFDPRVELSSELADTLRFCERFRST